MRTRRSASSSSNSVSSRGNSGAHLPNPPQEVGHAPVLLQEVLQMLAVQAGDVVLDATLGGGGHARELVKALDASCVFIGIDADEAALERTRTALFAASSAAQPHVHLVLSNFRKLDDVLRSIGIEKIDKALFDLGWSGYQLVAGRGFSFLADEPLLMTYVNAVKPETLTAGTIVNTWGEQSIADVIYGWGEEKLSRRIAKAIVEARTRNPITTSRQLADIIERTVPRRGKIHPATRTFQALRIAVNDELVALKTGLRAAWRALNPGGRIAVITFHSIEDREVKRMMQAWEQTGEGKRLSKKPIAASRDEMRANPRARSAKLRTIQKL